MSIGRALSIIEGIDRLIKEKSSKMKELKLKINKISKMNLKDYIKYKNGKVKNENQMKIKMMMKKEDTLMDEIEKKLTN